MTQVSIEIDAICSRCKDDVKITDGGGGAIYVEPCDSCIDVAYTEGIKEGETHHE